MCNYSFFVTYKVLGIIISQCTVFATPRVFFIWHSIRKPTGEHWASSSSFITWRFQTSCTLCHTTPSLISPGYDKRRFLCLSFFYFRVDSSGGYLGSKEDKGSSAGWMGNKYRGLPGGKSKNYFSIKFVLCLIYSYIILLYHVENLRGPDKTRTWTSCN